MYSTSIVLLATFVGISLGKPVPTPTQPALDERQNYINVNPSLGFDSHGPAGGLTVSYKQTGPGYSVTGLFGGGGGLNSDGLPQLSYVQADTEYITGPGFTISDGGATGVSTDLVVVANPTALTAASVIGYIGGGVLGQSYTLVGGIDSKDAALSLVGGHATPTGAAAISNPAYGTIGGSGAVPASFYTANGGGAGLAPSGAGQLGPLGAAGGQLSLGVKSGVPYLGVTASAGALGKTFTIKRREPMPTPPPQAV